VAGNVGYGLSRLPRAEREERVAALLEMTELDGLGSRRPDKLSGGQRQRVALARALAPEPQLLLLDEPFAALDFRIRRELRDALRSLHSRTGVPMILVTHALADVRSLAEELVLLDHGRVLAAGPTEEILAAPPSPEAGLLLRAEELG
jgi:ABC-type sulfate/molybdate transport systems ATPase subunit